MGLLKRLFGLEPIVQAIEQGGTEISDQTKLNNTPFSPYRSTKSAKSAKSAKSGKAAKLFTVL